MSNSHTKLTRLNDEASSQPGHSLEDARGGPPRRGQLEDEEVMWKAVGSVQFPMDAREAYQAIVRAGDAGPVVDVSANGVRFTCRPRPGLVQPGQYCVLMDASLIVKASPAVFYGLARALEMANSGDV